MMGLSRTRPAPSLGLREWSLKRARRLADEFLRDRDGIEPPAEFFARTVRAERLLAVYRDTAEPAFLERIAEVEGGNG